MGESDRATRRAHAKPKKSQETQRLLVDIRPAERRIYVRFNNVLTEIATKQAFIRSHQAGFTQGLTPSDEVRARTKQRQPATARFTQTRRQVNLEINEGGKRDEHE
jgi:hypothetical protein